MKNFRKMLLAVLSVMFVVSAAGGVSAQEITLEELVESNDNMRRYCLMKIYPKVRCFLNLIRWKNLKTL